MCGHKIFKGRIGGIPRRTADSFGRLLDIRFNIEGFNSFDSYDSKKKDFLVSYKETSFSQQIKMISRTINLFNSKMIILCVKILSRQNKSNNCEY